MIKKIIILLLIVTLLAGKVPFVLAQEAPPQQDAIPTQAPVPAQEAPKADKPDKGTVTPAPTQAPVPDQYIPSIMSPTPTPSPIPSTTNTLINEAGTDGITDNGNVGDTTINTGDANNTGNIINTGNENLNGSGSGSEGTGGATVVNSKNGTDSNNTGSANIVNSNNTNQDNSAVILNNMTQASITGENSASRNTGGDSSITTGDANVSGTVLTAANTNVDGVAISEFNIVDDHTGDFILDFQAGCIAGCNYGDLAVENTGNGDNSNNSGTLNNTNNDTTTQNNDGTVTNNIDFIANTGDNSASRNTGGDSSITTGDANVTANLMTFLNSNVAGGVMFGVVNIFGDLIGDIILPDNIFDQFNCGTCGGNTNIANTSNGDGSDNTAAVNNLTNNNVFQANDANIANNLIFDAQTGNNQVSRNTDGNNSIDTGNTNVETSILNIANMNLLGGNMWLVIVNEAGNWVGKLFGAPDGSNIAAADGMEFSYAPDGQINVTNEKNGSGSENNSSVNNTTNNNLNQTNTANIINNVNLLANTGGNDASRNTGGTSSIITGDAQAIANIVNFVNNNIAGGKLLVTFVNVFGSWNGDFMTPGSKKDTSPVVAQGGQEENKSNNQPSNNPTTNNTSVAAKGTSIIAAAGFLPQVFGIGSNNESDVEVKVAGANTNDIVAGLTKNSSDKKATLNLAWLLLATPLIAMGIIARKRFIKRTV